MKKYPVIDVEINLNHLSAGLFWKIDSIHYSYIPIYTHILCLYTYILYLLTLLTEGRLVKFTLTKNRKLPTLRMAYFTQEIDYES